MRNDRAYLEHMAENIQIIREYLGGPEGRPEAELFFGNRLIQDGVVRRLETLADAAGHLSEVLKARHPQIDWRKMTGFRNRLAHGYLEIDLNIVWEIVAADLLPLQAIVDRELNPP